VNAEREGDQLVARATAIDQALERMLATAKAIADFDQQVGGKSSWDGSSRGTSPAGSPKASPRGAPRPASAAAPTRRSASAGVSYSAARAGHSPRSPRTPREQLEANLLAEHAQQLRRTPSSALEPKGQGEGNLETFKPTDSSSWTGLLKQALPSLTTPRGSSEQSSSPKSEGLKLQHLKHIEQLENEIELLKCDVVRLRHECDENHHTRAHNTALQGHLEIVERVVFCLASCLHNLPRRCAEQRRSLGKALQILRSPETPHKFASDAHSSALVEELDRLLKESSAEQETLKDLSFAELLEHAKTMGVPERDANMCFDREDLFTLLDEALHDVKEEDDRPRRSSLDLIKDEWRRPLSASKVQRLQETRNELQKQVSEASSTPGSPCTSAPATPRLSPR